ncbi:MAG: M18 family aminopeptidase [Spirochaetia bacterium]|jgi:aspartyl aminopeptidase|nr:M18 family aminopeptidase [Spirochaetia bacterium]
MSSIAKNLCDFIDASPTPYQAVENLAAFFTARGALELKEEDVWRLEPGAAYFVQRGGTALVAFRPGFHSPGLSGYILAGAHTDSPCLKLRPGAELRDRSMLRLAVEPYGSAILAGWMDRPLGLAGRVIVMDQGAYKAYLYNSNGAVGIIPGLAIHLDRELNKGMELKAHTHMPVLVDILEDEASPTEPERWLASKLAEELGLRENSILSMDLSFYDPQKALFFGKQRTAAGLEASAPENTEQNLPSFRAGELINAPRLDNLAGCSALSQAFWAASPGLSTQLACFMDAEEIGSRSPQGADSSFIRDILARINLGLKGSAEDFYRAGSRSLCVSVDAAQAWNPAYADKYDSRFSPRLGAGPALKLNASRRYATDSVTEALFSRLCQSLQVPWQKYMARADSQPGSTIGPITAARLGFRCLDIGHPMLSMHAARETIDSADHGAVCSLLRGFYQMDAESLKLP